MRCGCGLRKNVDRKKKQYSFTLISFSLQVFDVILGKKITVAKFYVPVTKRFIYYVQKFSFQNLLSMKTDI